MATQTAGGGGREAATASKQKRCVSGPFVFQGRCNESTEGREFARGDKAKRSQAHAEIRSKPACFFVYGNDKLLISAEGYLSRSSPWLGKGTQSLQPSDRPHFRRRRSHLFIWGSGNERMVSGARRVLRSGDGPRPLSLRLSD